MQEVTTMRSSSVLSRFRLGRTGLLAALLVSGCAASTPQPAPVVAERRISATAPACVP
jgi:hypothetical protein